MIIGFQKGNIPWNKGKPWSKEIKDKISKTKTKKYLLKIEDDFDFGYILGVMLGDGWTRKGTVGLDSIDEDFIIFFKNIFEKYYKIKGCVRKKKSRITLFPNGKIYECKPYFKLEFNSVYLSTFFKDFMKQINLGFVKNKSEEFKKGMIKGLFDSEGSIGKYVRFSNTNDNLHQIFTFLLQDALKINSYKETRSNGTNITFFNKRYDMKKFINTIGITIKRKYEKFKITESKTDHRIPILIEMGKVKSKK